MPPPFRTPATQARAQLVAGRKVVDEPIERLPERRASVRAEVVSDLRRATGVQHHRRTEPSATNAANGRSAQYQRNPAVTTTANDAWKAFTLSVPPTSWP